MSKQSLQTPNKTKKKKDPTSFSLSGLLKNCSPLVGATKIFKEAEKSGFTWPNESYLYKKIQEEIVEVKEVMSTFHQSSPLAKERLEEELGDLLLATVNLCQYLGVDPTIALNRGAMKFSARYDRMMQIVPTQTQSFSIETWLKYWDEAKEKLKIEMSLKRKRL